MLYQYTPIQRQTKERIWQVPYIPKKQRTSLVNFTKPKVKRNFVLVTKKDGARELWQYKYNKRVSVLVLPHDIDISKVEQFMRDYAL